MEGLSKKEIELVSWLEFYKKYFFTASTVDKFVKTKLQRYNLVKGLVRKKRIVKLNRMKYYLIPIKAKSGAWTEFPAIVADEICDGKDYFIGGWYSANYWRLTEQIPMQVDMYTTRRQGRIKLLNIKIVFHRTTKKRILEDAVEEKIEGHTFRIQNKEASKKWIKSRR